MRKVLDEYQLSRMMADLEIIDTREIKCYKPVKSTRSGVEDAYGEGFNVDSWEEVYLVGDVMSVKSEWTWGIFGQGIEVDAVGFFKGDSEIEEGWRVEDKGILYKVFKVKKEPLGIHKVVGLQKL